MSKQDRCGSKAAMDGDQGGSVGNKDEEGTRDVSGAPKPDGPRLTKAQRRYT